MPGLLSLALLIQSGFPAQQLPSADAAILQFAGDLGDHDTGVTHATPLAKGAGRQGKFKKKSSEVDKSVTVQPSTEEDEKSPKSALDLARQLGISSDDSRPNRQREATLFGKRVVIGGKLTADLRGRSAYDLVRRAKDDDVTAAPEATLDAILLPSETSVVFASVKATGEVDAYKQAGGARSTAGIGLNALWLLKARLAGTPLAVQVGRQKLQERRNWWWDDDIDAARLHYFGSKVTAFVGIGSVNAVYLSTLGRVEPEDRGLLRSFGTAEWEWRNRHTIAAFALHQTDRTGRYAIGQLVNRNDSDKQDANLTWIGARARGCFKAKLPRRICYWGDIAQVRGSEISYNFSRIDAKNSLTDRLTDRNVRGWAYDVGTSIELPLKFKPYLTLGYAWGSGDPAGTPGLDGAFRQTGLHKNDGEYLGLTRFRYYGEVLRPNLSNIAITTAAIGLPVGHHSWIETVWHRYRQPIADKTISGSKLDRNPNGVGRKLGNEVDVIFSHRPASGWVFELTGGAFRAGSAFGRQEGRVAGLIDLKVDYNF
jgi:alginate production protein